jgi:hypothetical protein
MEKVILFNEDEEYHEFSCARNAAKFLGVTQDKVIFSGKVNKNSKLKGYYVEIEEDRIVQYHYRVPIRIWYSIREVSDTLLVHQDVVSKSLEKSNECIEKLHFKYFSQTKGRPL